MESSLPSLVLSLYQVTLALPTHSQPRRARSRSKADVESLRAAEGARPSQPQWGGVKEGQGDTDPLGGAALQVFSREGSSYVCKCMYTCVHVHVEARGQANCHSSGTLVFYCLRQSLTGLGPPIRLEGLDSEPQRSTCLPLPGADIVSVHHHAQLLSCKFWGQTWSFPAHLRCFSTVSLKLMPSDSKGPSKVIAPSFHSQKGN